MNFPFFDEQLSFLNQFVLELVDEYHTGKINSWDALDERVKLFFTPKRMDQTESLLPGWKKMASHSNGVTLTHVMCVFLGMFTMPEFQALTLERQQMAKWIVLFHDVEKVHINGKRDHTHAFRSAITVVKALKATGFVTTNQYTDVFESWQEITLSAITDSTIKPAEIISDNSKLPEIIQGVEKMYGRNTPASLIVKGVMLHMSINVVKDWPQPAPLSSNEIARYVDSDLLPLLKVMHLADNEGWSMFEPEIRAIQRSETLEAFERIEEMILKRGTVSSSNMRAYSPTMNHKQTVKSGYNKIADRYLAERSRDTADVRALNDFIELLAPKSKVLDAGCGAGIPITQILTEYFDVTGVDFSEAQFEHAKKNVPNAQFICADITQLDLPAESLDGICSYYAIIHIPREEHASLLANFYRMLKFGGVALLCLGAEDLVDDIDDNFLGTKMYWSHFNANTYINMLKDCGFSIIWAKRVPDETFDGAEHLFALVQKVAK